MRIVATLAIVALLVPVPFAANAATSGTGSLKVSARFHPSPPKRGAETILISVKDVAGKPVKGAVVKVGSSMPAMSMDGPSLSLHDNGNGTYAAKTTLNFATKWSFAISATKGSQQGATILQADVK